MKRPRRVWRTLGARRRIGPCRTCGLSLGLHNRRQRISCREQQALQEIPEVLARIDAKLRARGSSLEQFIDGD